MGKERWNKEDWKIFGEEGLRLGLGLALIFLWIAFWAYIKTH